MSFLPLPAALSGSLPLVVLREVLAGYSMQTIVRFSKCKQGDGSKKSLHKQTEKTLPSRETSSSVLCSDSICSKTAPIALNALRIEPKYLYNFIFHIQWSNKYIMSSRRMSTTFYGSKAISAGCNRTDWKFQQNAKYDEISERKTRVIYLCLAEGKKAGLQSLEQEA